MIDTIVFSNIIPVPNRDQDRDSILEQLEDLIKSRTTLLLPMAAVLERGNHIAQLPKGNDRYSTAKMFCEQVCDAIDGKTPWTPTPFWDENALRNWLGEFPGDAKIGHGLGDLSIIKEWEKQRKLIRKRRIFIWSLDQHLIGYDSGD